MPKQNNHWQLERVKGHPGYWKNPVSNIIYWRGTIKGKKFKKSTGETQISRARTFIDDFVLKLTSDNINRAKRASAGVVNPRLGDIWQEIIEERTPTRSHATAERYELIWRLYLGPFWADRHISDMNKKVILKFESEFRTKFKGKSFAQVKKYLEMLINHLFHEQYIEKKLKVQDLDRAEGGYAKRKKHFRVYKPDEQDALVMHAVNLRTKVVIVGYQDTGARNMELLSAGRDQVDFEADTIKLWSQKNKEWRVLPLTMRFKDALREWLAQAIESDYLFPAPRDPGTHIASQVFNKDWIATKKAAKIKGRARIHDLRHTVATKTSEDKWPTKYACEFLDMSPTVYLDTYVHTTASGLLDLVRTSFDIKGGPSDV
jgi:integrase